MWSMAILLLFVVGLGVFLAANEGRFIYFPARDYASTPESYGLRGEPIEITAPDGTPLKGWWIRNGGKQALLYFHGNGGNISHRLERTKMLTELGLDVSPGAVAQRYAGLIDGFVLERTDPVPAPLPGVTFVQTATLMSSVEDRLELARAVLRAADALSI